MDNNTMGLTGILLVKVYFHGLIYGSRKEGLFILADRDANRQSWRSETAMRFEGGGNSNVGGVCTAHISENFMAA